VGFEQGLGPDWQRLIESWKFLEVCDFGNLHKTWIFNTAKGFVEEQNSF
jgi:hypothetical protein